MQSHAIGEPTQCRAIAALVRWADAGETFCGCFRRRHRAFFALTDGNASVATHCDLRYLALQSKPPNYLDAASLYLKPR